MESNVEVQSTPIFSMASFARDTEAETPPTTTMSPKQSRPGELASSGVKPYCRNTKTHQLPFRFINIESGPRRRVPDVVPAYSRVLYNQYVAPQNFAYHYLIPIYPATLLFELQSRNESPVHRRENVSIRDAVIDYEMIRNADISQDPEMVRMIRKILMDEQDELKTGITNQQQVQNHVTGLHSKPTSFLEMPRPFKMLNSGTRYYQDILIERPSLNKIEFGHIMETPNGWEVRYERNDMKGNHYQGKVKWADKNGGYGEHYWDLAHA